MSFDEHIKAEVIYDLQHSYGYTLEQVEAGEFELDEGYPIHMSNDIKLQFLVEKVLDDMWSKYNQTMMDCVEPSDE